MNLEIANYCKQLALRALLKIPNFPTFYETIKITKRAFSFMGKWKKGGVKGKIVLQFLESQIVIK